MEKLDKKLSDMDVYIFDDLSILIILVLQVRLLEVLGYHDIH